MKKDMDMDMDMDDMKMGMHMSMPMGAMDYEMGRHGMGMPIKYALTNGGMGNDDMIPAGDGIMPCGTDMMPASFPDSKYFGGK